MKNSNQILQGKKSVIRTYDKVLKIAGIFKSKPFSIHNKNSNYGVVTVQSGGPGCGDQGGRDHRRGRGVRDGWGGSPIRGRGGEGNWGTKEATEVASRQTGTNRLQKGTSRRLIPLLGQPPLRPWVPWTHLRPKGTAVYPNPWGGGRRQWWWWQQLWRLLRVIQWYFGDRHGQTTTWWESTWMPGKFREESECSCLPSARDNRWKLWVPGQLFVFPPGLY